jgi:hypothetical protein
VSGSTRQGLQLLVGAWYVAGAVLLIALLAKGDVEGLSARVAGSALAVILLGFAVVAGARLAERPTNLGLVGALTALVSTATFFLLAVEIWSKDPMEKPERTMTMVAISILLGTISLLLDGSREEDSGPLRLARGVAVAALLALGTLIVLAVSDVDVSERLGGIAAALFLIPTLSLPALRVLSNER